MDENPQSATDTVDGQGIILITTLAEYQTRFWVLIGMELRCRSIPVAFLSFDDRSTSMLRDAGFTTFALKSEDEAMDLSDTALELALQQFGVENFPFWSSHERFIFGLKERALRQKFLSYLSLSDRAFKNLRGAGFSPILVQELGGFLSNIASFFTARRLGFDNWFIEPAFFRGRLFLLKNQFESLEIPELLGTDSVSLEVKRYLSSTVSNGSIVVPKKDAHQYKPAARKIFHYKNIIRLLQKLFDKHVLGKKQEFQYIWHHVWAHIKMLLNSLRLSRHYTPLEQIEHFIYYPLHVPGDMALTLRSPQYLDQLALIDFLMRSIPNGYHVAIKEHPAMIGAVGAGDLMKLKRRYENLFFLSPATNNYRVINSSELVISVNSKSGAEAALLGKPVLVLGDAFYRKSPLVYAIDNIGNLRSHIHKALMDHYSSPPVNEEFTNRYFEAVWKASCPGELYVEDNENVKRFVDSLLRISFKS